MFAFNNTISKERHNSLSTFSEMQSKSIFEQLYQGKGGK